jgi:hypothetical protein
VDSSSPTVSRPTVSRPLRAAALAELLYAPVPLFLALTLLPLGATGASPGLLGVYLVQAGAAVGIGVGLRRGWWPARVAALLLAAYVLALAFAQGPALATAAFGRRDTVSVATLAVAAWAWLTQMVAFAGALPDLTRAGQARGR